MVCETCSNGGGRKTCPMCGTNDFGGRLVLSPEHIAKELPTRCRMRAEGCGFVGAGREAIRKHQSVCPAREIQCPHSR